jgi:hypothetical protein
MLILDPRASHYMLSGLSALNLNTPIVTFMETLNLVCLHCVIEGGRRQGLGKFFFECSISSVNCYEFRGRHFHSHWQSIAIFFMVLIVAEPLNFRVLPLSTRDNKRDNNGY